MATPPSPAQWSDALVARVLDDALRHGARVLGISGLQGTGKSTLATQLAAAGRARGLAIAVLSLDDLYLDHRARQHLARTVHPLLATRGPPGTHEVALGCALLDTLRTGGSARLPRFDKGRDDRRPAADWTSAGPVALTVFEGWCLGATPEPAEALAAPINALERDEDPDGTWRRWCNAALARDYPALWQRVGRLLFLQPPGFEVVPAWRWQQEQALRSAARDRAGMDRAQVERFVQHYERVSRRLLRTLPDTADVVIALDAQRRVRLPG
ncbi:kinase [Luteimonas sp. RC10]|uniref:kinase n=1 Tax=Luteimonas sp. RC10 TaxID=2587035 RepID=UPI00160B8697|nr:kinase [Luteimonas sp. RC10]MBB3344986.1 D-glycerate 3-kinase [Luteimonas sp. RC10]